MMKIAVSYLKSKNSLAQTIKEIDQTSADYIHVDLMDGLFVPEKNIDLKNLTTVLKNHQKPLDIHLMVENPLLYIDSLRLLSPDYITFQIEIANVSACINKIKEHQIKVGLALKPSTNITSVLPYLNQIDSILVMSVEPGKGGQQFNESVIPKITELRKLQEKYPFTIHIDGGINEESIKKIPQVDLVVSGSFVCMADNYEKQIERLRCK